ncbi:cation:proton antiporter [Ilumatobacter sp.]|uniref:cation:proton antiporter n=1 Tax=Ilumatobacter sp. TaxID=1967498 RepID=UPI003C5ACC04
MSDNEIIVGLSSILVLGIGAQWIGRRVRIPSLLLLLPAGILSGDVLGLVEPQELFGDMLFPLVTLLLSLLLFQSGLQLRVADLPKGSRRSVARLVTIGLIITFVGGSITAMLILGLPRELAFVTGAILSVSGPTVVGPILETVRPREPLGSVLRWEGTTLDPLGATIGVIVMNLVLRPDGTEIHPLVQLAGRLGLGVVVGAIAAAVLVFVMSRFLLTDDMEASVAVLFAVAAFAIAEIGLSEAGLFAATTMGIVVANQRLVKIDRITGFGETLDVLVIGTLFIVLGALIAIDDLVEYALPSLGIATVLVLVVRPLTAAVSLLKTPLTTRERVFVAWMDPRGIVAAATAAQFALQLADKGYDVTFMLPVVFGVIITTGVIYGLSAKPVARALGVARAAPRGIGLFGDDPWLASFGHALVTAGVPTVLIVSSEAERAGKVEDDEMVTVSLHGSAVAVDEAMEQADLAKVLVSFHPGAVHSVFVARLTEHVGRRHVLLLPDEVPTIGGVSDPWTPRPFGGRLTRTELDRRLGEGWTIAPGASTDDSVDGSEPLAVVHEDGTIDLDPRRSTSQPADVVIALIPPGPARPVGYGGRS